MNCSVLLLLICVVAYQADAQTEKRRICYHTNWSQYRPDGGKFFPENIDPFLCSHIIYSFATMTGNQLSPYEWNDDSMDWAKGMYERTIALKKQNPTLVITLAVGGWNFGTQKMTAMLATAQSRAEFIQTSINYLRSRNFDGLDLDFEYPGNRGSPPDDKQRYTLLVQELRAAFNAETVPAGKNRLILSVAVSAGKDNIDSAYEVRTVCGNVDFINLMSYDFFGAWDNVTGMNSPLYPTSTATGWRATFNTDYAARYWVQNGCPAEKMNIGMGTYGRCFQLANAAVNGVEAPIRGPCTAGTWTREAGFLSYYEICQMLQKPGTVKIFDVEQVSAYAYNGDQWVGFDDLQSFTIKVNYIKNNGFGGAMIWAIDLDDFSGNYCGGGRYPLLSQMNQVLNGYIPTAPTTPVPSTTAGPSTTTTPVPTTTTRGTTTPYTGTSTAAPPATAAPAYDSANFCQSKADGIYPDPADCNKYYNCWSGQTHSQACTTTLYFNPDITGCDWPSNLSPTRKASCGLARRRRRNAAKFHRN